MEKCAGIRLTHLTKTETKSVKIEREPKRSYECFDCKKTFKFKQTAERHMKLHSSGKPLQCNVRPLNYFQADIKISHKCLLHECNICTFTAKFSDVKTHLAEVHGKKNIFPCDKCSEKFSSKCNLLKHLRAHKPNETLKECYVCDKKFRSAVSLSSHKIIHSKSLKCQICEKKFLKRDRLKYHTEHTHGKKHECQFCDKRFVDKFYLVVHIRAKHFSWRFK